MEFVVGDEKRTMEPGDIAIIPGGVPHGGHAITECRVIDVFAPIRADWRKFAPESGRTPRWP